MAELAATMAAAVEQARHRPIQPDGHLVRRQGRAVAGGAAAGAGAGAGAGSAGRDPPGRAPSRRPARRRRWRAGSMPIPSGSARCRPPDPAVQAKTAGAGRRGCAGPTATPISKRGCAASPTPTLVLFGTLDRVIPPEMGRFYKELLPNCHLVFVYDAGHAISTERPEAFAEVTADFLERHEAFVISRTETVIHPVITCRCRSARTACRGCPPRRRCR